MGTSRDAEGFVPEETGDMSRGLADVCDSVENLRAAQGLTRDQLAELSDISPATIKKFEYRSKGLNPTPQTLKKLSRGFGLNDSRLSDIRAGREPKIPPSEPRVKRKAEERLEEISRQVTAINQNQVIANERLASVNERLASVEASLHKLMSRVDVMFRGDNPPEHGD